MKRTDFSYQLPADLIAQQPLPQRSASRLLVLDGASGEVSHHHFPELLDFLRDDDLLVFNNTRVIPARLWGQKATGGKVEVLIERLTGSYSALAHIRSSKSPKPGTEIYLCAVEGAEVGGHRLSVEGRAGALFELASPTDTPMADILNDIGHMPLPPYIQRVAQESDEDRYQTVYARYDGAVAAPTAGLHFTQELLAAIDDRGIQRAEVTLHVGAGTFQPVRAELIENHEMHCEFLEVSQDTCDAVEATRARGGRVIAVGTTAVRALESACQKTGRIAPYRGDTDIFIYPGCRFYCVDAMVTNFHLPESTLLMLVSAFAGREPIMAAYASAIAERYRFFSYGDAMFITANQEVLQHSE